MISFLLIMIVFCTLITLLQYLLKPRARDGTAPLLVLALSRSVDVFFPLEGREWVRFYVDGLEASGYEMTSRASSKSFGFLHPDHTFTIEACDISGHAVAIQVRTAKGYNSTNSFIEDLLSGNVTAADVINPVEMEKTAELIYALSRNKSLKSLSIIVPESFVELLCSSPRIQNLTTLSLTIQTQLLTPSTNALCDLLSLDRMNHFALSAKGYENPRLFEEVIEESTALESMRIIDTSTGEFFATQLSWGFLEQALFRAPQIRCIECARISTHRLRDWQYALSSWRHVADALLATQFNENEESPFHYLEVILPDVCNLLLPVPERV
eukprot:TRINITY_DN16067_c0_g1_i1.p1 TRINITY_DN16067_c0_g1~~TRINITY_DN16067_c0_g1_i1.p1  ORF type:complete len:326 (-),score=44.14 TRINITY_DN16067_c0_g1_i1:23-1000(-)